MRKRTEIPVLMLPAYRVGCVTHEPNRRERNSGLSQSVMLEYGIFASKTLVSKDVPGWWP